jgi:hypothetical protein
MTMKKNFCLALVLSVLSICSAPAQPSPLPQRSIPLPQPLPNNFQQRVQQIIQNAGGQPADSSELTTFNLDFPGGTPRQLADAIEKSMGKPINVIVPDEYAATKIPPIKVTGVTVPQLFQTLLEGSQKRTSRGDMLSSYGFKSIDGRNSDTTIWTFFVYNNQEAAGLTSFNIDFPGGTPKELVAAIQKATGKQLNVVIPPEYADTKLPPLKMNSVNVSQLFRALEAASAKYENPSPYVLVGGNNRTSDYGFRTDGNITDDSIWYFHSDRPAPYSPEKISRFYNLAPYLDHGLKVDDITTAVETAWKMAGEKSPPEISFHKDTQLLIAVGEGEKLKTIDNVLQALKPETVKIDTPKPKSFTPSPAPEKKSGDAPKSEE